MRYLFALSVVALVAATSASAHGGPHATALTITHTRRGCHVWAYGSRRGPILRLSEKHGSVLTVVNRDVESHRLVQTAGRAVTRGTTLHRGQAVQLIFRRAGTYRFEARPVGKPGRRHLRLVVRVS